MKILTTPNLCREQFVEKIIPNEPIISERFIINN